MNKLDKLKQEYEKLGKAIKEFENEDKWVLKLWVDGNSTLIIGFKPFEYLGYINSKGECSILTDDNTIGNYEKWLEHGCKIDKTSVEWKDGKYGLDDNWGDICLYSINKDNDAHTFIYHFSECLPGTTTDPNIKTFKHNNRVILY